MTHGYRSLQYWDQWLAQHHLGMNVLKAEKIAVSKLLANHFGKQALLIGSPNQETLLDATAINIKSMLTPFIITPKNTQAIESDLRELPILTGSIDLVMLSHTLERVDSPRQLLNEACRVVKPEGLIVIFGFKPFSLWWLKRKLRQRQLAKWHGDFIHAQQLKSWLRLADFAIEQQTSLFLTPPVEHEGIFNHLVFIEKWGGRYFRSLGSIYMVIARAKVVPLTPIKFKLKWKPTLTTMPSSIIGHSAR